MSNVAILALIPGLALAANAGTPRESGKPVGSNPSPSAAARPAPKAPGGPPEVTVKGLRMITAATAERIPLPRLRGPVVVSVDALARRVRLIPSRKDSASALLSQVTKHLGTLCPTAVLKDGAVELSCRSARFEAQITTQGKNSFLDLNELRGLPWRPGADAPPSFFYDPWKAGFGQSCPGRSPGARGECALHEGNQLQAAIQFRSALDTTARQLACVRLGDLAMATGDPITASGWYRRSGPFGYFGRIAESRLCELDGHCLKTSEEVLKAFDSAGLPEPLRAEALMRGARAEAYMGRLRSAVHIIAAQVGAHGPASICREGGEVLCRRILLEGMREAALAAPLEPGERQRLEEMLDTYMAIPLWEKGPLAVEMAAAAAALAVRLGAPSFAGNLLASLAPEVPDAQLPNHLLAAAEAFIKGENWPRARIIAEYAQSRLTGGRKSSDKWSASGKSAKARTSPSLQSPRWTAVFRTLARHEELDEISPELRAAIEAEFAATTAELKNAHDTLEKVESVLGGTRAAAGAAPTKSGDKNPAPAPAPATAGTGAAEGKAAAEPGAHSAPDAAKVRKPGEEKS